MSNSNGLTALLSQYEKNKNSQTTTTSSVGKNYDLKNYFALYLAQNEKEGIRRIRILPTTEFVEIHAHNIKIDATTKTFVCPKHLDGSDCPFCEARQALLATGKDADKEIAKKYSARKMYIVKVIDRDNEDHGVKFWRFKHDWTNKGIYDKIMGIIRALNQDITDPRTGRDLVIQLSRDTSGNQVVTSITQVDPTSLSNDAEQEKQWLSDNRTWRDVYAVKTYDYLEVIVKGGTPYYDKTTGKFIDKSLLGTATPAEVSDDLDEELSIGLEKEQKTNETPIKDSKVETSLVTSQDDDDDLPF